MSTRSRTTICRAESSRCFPDLARYQRVIRVERQESDENHESCGHSGLFLRFTRSLKAAESSVMKCTQKAQLGAMESAFWKLLGASSRLNR